MSIADACGGCGDVGVPWWFWPIGVVLFILLIIKLRDVL